MFYEDIVYRHFENPSNVGVINLATHTAMLGDPHSGAVLKLTAKIKNNLIEEIAFKAYGGGAAIACMSLLTEKVKGKTVEDALKLDMNQLNSELHLEPVKYVYAIMAIDILRKLLVK